MLQADSVLGSRNYTYKIMFIIIKKTLWLQVPAGQAGCAAAGGGTAQREQRPATAACRGLPASPGRRGGPGALSPIRGAPGTAAAGTARL